MLQFLVQEAGLQAIANLEDAFKECDRVVETQDKQAIPAVQQNALSYVGQIEEAMVKGFPFEVPSQYDNLPQLKVCLQFLDLHRSPSRAAMVWNKHHRLPCECQHCISNCVMLSRCHSVAYVNQPLPLPPLKAPPHLFSQP